MTKGERLKRHVSGFSASTGCFTTCILTMIVLQRFGFVVGLILAVVFAVAFLAVLIRYVEWIHRAPCHTLEKEGRMVWRCCRCNMPPAEPQAQNVDDPRCRECGHTWCGDFNDWHAHCHANLAIEKHDLEVRLRGDHLAGCPFRNLPPPCVCGSDT